MSEVFEQEFRFFKLHHNTYTIVTFLAEASTARRCARFQAFGAFFALHTMSTNRGPQRTSFALPLAMLLTPDEFIRMPLKYIRHFDAEAAQQLQPWVLLDKDAAFPKTPHPSNSEHHSALINMLLELNINVSPPRESQRAALNMHPQAALIDDDRSEAAHDVITKMIFCRVLFDLDPSQIWGHPEFEAFKLGYNMQVEYGKTTSPRFLSVSCHAPPTPLLLLTIAPPVLQA